MNNKYKPFLVFRLRQDMEEHGFGPSIQTKLEADGKIHRYEALCCIRKQKAYYAAEIDNFGGKLPILIANYGNYDGERHTCTVSIYELITE